MTAHFTIENHHAVSGGDVCDILIHDSDVSVQMFISAKYSGPRDGLQGYRPSEVYVKGVEKWSFHTCGADLTRGQVAELYEYDGGFVIVVQDRGSVISVAPVIDLAHRVKVKIDGIERYIGGSSRELLLEMKVAIAQIAGLLPAYTKEEQDLLKTQSELATAQSRERAVQRMAARASEDAAARAAREAAVVQKAARIAEISARQQVSGVTADGRQRFGIPVTGDEWQCLPDGKYCITMQGGQPYEAFVVSRIAAGGHARQMQRAFISAPVTAKGVSISQTDTTISAICEKSLTIKGEVVSVPVFASMEVVKRLRAAGLNGGTLVAVSNDFGKSGEVYAIHSDGIKTIGQFKPARPA